MSESPNGNGPGAPPESISTLTSDILLGVSLEGNDETPTIISKSAPAPVPSESLNGSLRGRTLAHFELLEPIGVGGMAAVLRARDRQLDRFVALKILPPEMAVEPENVRRFHQEARAAARLDHENIARVFFCGEDQKLHFIAFEFVEGDNLRAILERRGRLPVREAIHYVLQIAAGLDHAASRGVVHRDIKPSNIIITPTGRAKLVDMGLARSLEPHADNGLTQSGVTLGTFDYISPEQALEPRDADARSDIYSLGCTLYHMLTGQPPVPEGTAARKLHHHQHVPPVDPRQLNPEIPDSVAAVLARMMAKNAKERYQRPEHLVQHLLQVAQELGSAPEVPEGLLFVDAPLPNPPLKRPGLTILLAIGALAIILALLSFVPLGTTPSQLPRDSSRSRSPRPPQPEAVGVHGKAEVPRSLGPPPAMPQGAVDARDLADLLAASPPPAGRSPVRLEKTVELGAGMLVCKGGPSTDPLTLEPKDPSGQAVLHFAYRAEPGYHALAAGLVIAGGHVVFRNLKFELDVGMTPETTVVAAVLIHKGSTVTFERCTFEQKAPLQPFIADRRHLIPAASVATENPGGGSDGRPQVTFSECFFAEGQTAVAVNGPASVRSVSCAFGPHGALFHVRGPGEHSLELNHCSAFVVYGPAFRLDGDAGCKLDVRFCIFSNPETGVSEAGSGQRDQPDLIKQTDRADPVVLFTGQRNCYHSLNALWVRPRGKLKDTVVDFRDFRAEVARLGGSADENSSQLPPGKRPGPWASHYPLKQLPSDAREAFYIHTGLPEVRELSDPGRPLGVEKCVWGPTYSGEVAPLPMPAPVVAAAPNPHEKVVDPAVTEAGAGVYRSLEAAFADAMADDVIYIRHNGPLAVNQVHVQADLKVTVRPAEGCRPVLTLSARTAEPEAALFRLHLGQVRFERLAFELEPERKDVRAQSVVALGGGQCTFKDCVFTLRPAHAPDARLTVATLAEVKDVKMAAPQLALQNCLVRGEGDFLTVPHSRPFGVSLENCAVALAGSLLVVAGNSAEVAAMDAVRTPTLELNRVTAYLGDHLVQLEDRKNGKGLVLTSVSARDCLFAGAPGSGKSLIHLDGLNTPEQRQRLFDWRGAHNAYSGFDRVLERTPAMIGLPVERIEPEKWGMFASEDNPEPRFGKARFDFEQARERPLAEVQPADFRTHNEQLQGYGANLDSLTSLPLPSRTAPAAPAPEQSRSDPEAPSLALTSADRLP